MHRGVHRKAWVKLVGCLPRDLLATLLLRAKTNAIVAVLVLQQARMALLAAFALSLLFALLRRRGMLLVLVRKHRQVTLRVV